MIDKNLILWLPLNDPDGNVAYDYSISRNNGALTDGAAFKRDAEKGKALSFNGAGECLTARTLPLSSDFTLALSVKAQSSQLVWLINLPGVNNYEEQALEVTPGEWTNLAFVKENHVFMVYQDCRLVYKDVIADTPQGFSINDCNVDGTDTMIDNVKLFNVSKIYAEVLKIWANTDVEYYLDGNNFKDFGVYVSASSGVTGKLARKESLTVDWDNYHGTVRDNKRVRYQSRKITLECFIEASSRTAFLEWVGRFMDILDGDGTHRLKIDVDGTRPLVYEVVQLNEVDPQKEWGTYNEELMVGTFKLELIEDEPVKRVLRHVGAANTTATITLSSNKMLNVYWGDGTHTYNVSGTNVNLSHTYAYEGEFDIVITGVIEDIITFSTNAIILWDKLK